MVARPHVLRAFAQTLRDAALAIEAFPASVHAEAGAGSFFLNMAESFVPMAVRAGLVASDEVDRWLAAQREASERGTFFGACNYHAYLARKPVGVRADASTRRAARLS